MPIQAKAPTRSSKRVTKNVDQFQSPIKPPTKAPTTPKKTAKNAKTKVAKSLTKLKTPTKAKTKAQKVKTPIKVIKSPAAPATRTPIKLTIKTTKKSKFTPQQAIETALNRLHSSSVPDSVPCRETQFQEIFEFVEGKLLDGEGGCMYVSGVPGTGKTTTLNEVQRRLENCSYLPKFKYISINAVQLGDAKKFYSHFCSLLFHQNLTDKQAFQELNTHFTDGKPNKCFTILFVDEFDYLKTKNQDILYMLFDWPKQKNSKFVIISIANTMDLPEHSMLKLSSRIAFTRIAFHPYNYDELEKILNSRLKDLVDSEVFQLDALKLICRKVAGVSGDARRVLDIARRSVEIAIAARRTRVEITDVAATLQEIFNSTKIVAVRSCSIQEQIFLRALVQESRANGGEECRFIDIYRIHIDICRLEGEYTPSTSELSQIAIKFDQSKMITLEKSQSHLYRKVLLNISPEDIDLALNLNMEN